MKKVKSLMAVAVAVSVTLSATVPAFAVNAPGRFATPDPIVLAPVVDAGDQVEEAAPAAAVFADLAHTSRTFVDNIRIPRGTYPVLANAAQNPDFARLNRVFFNNIFSQFHNQAQVETLGMDLSFHASFTVEDFGQFAVITQTLVLGNMGGFRDGTVLEFVFYIDKATNRQATEADFNAYLEAQEAAEAEEPVIEEAEYVEEVAPVVEEVEEVEEAPVEEVAPAAEEVEAAEEAVEPVVEFLPLGMLEDFGFEILFDEEDDFVIVTLDGEFVLSFTVGADYVTVGDAETVELPAATYFEEGYIVVPAYLFVEILGLELPVYEADEEQEELEEDVA